MFITKSKLIDESADYPIFFQMTMHQASVFDQHI